ncbi:MAG: hypothetical protein WAM17_18125, partial [Rhodoplanes sp.]
MDRGTRRNAWKRLDFDVIVVAHAATHGGAWKSRQFRKEISGALPERGVTFHTGDMGDTFGPLRESRGAVEGVSRHGRAGEVHR